MLKNLPIIPYQTSQKFYPLFLFYSHSTTPTIPFYSIESVIISQCRSDYIKTHGSESRGQVK